MEKTTGILELKDVHQLTGLTIKTIKLWAHDGRLPKPIKRKHPNEPYRWKKSEILKWLGQDTMPSNEHEIREVVRSELIRVLPLANQAARPPIQNQ